MEKRNWFKSPKDERIMCGDDGTAEYCIPYIYLQYPLYGDGLEIMTWHSGYYGTAEMIETKEDLDSLIETLQEVREGWE